MAYEKGSGRGVWESADVINSEKGHVSDVLVWKENWNNDYGCLQHIHDVLLVLLHL